MGHLPTSLIAASVFIAAVASTTCYSPDGSVQDYGQPAFQPCNQVVGQVSMCCGTNWTGGIVAKDLCQPNGLCLNSANGEPLYWRSSCTDKTWKSPLCLKNLCTTYAEGGDPTQNVALTECNDGSWCCQGGNTTCCDAGLGLKIAATIGASVPSSTSSSASKTSSISSSSSIASSTSSTSTTSSSSSGNTPGNTSAPNSLEGPQNVSKGSSGLSTGAKAGIAIAAVVAGLACIALGVLLWQRRRKPYDMPLPHAQTTQYGSVPRYEAPPVEADSREKRAIHEIG